MFKIFNVVLLSALILIVSIACSSAPPEEAPPEEYVTQVEYNKLLAYTSELESRLTEFVSGILFSTSVISFCKSGPPKLPFSLYPL